MEQRCRGLGCAPETPLAYLVINDTTNLAEGGFCEEHAKPVLGKVITGYHLEQIPLADSVTDRPLKTTPKPEAAHPPAPATKGPPMAEPTMAPTDAVYPAFDGDSREPELDHEAREERKILADEMSSNFRMHIGHKQIFDVQITLRGDYSSEKYRQFVRKLTSDIEFSINAGGRGTVRYAPGQEATVTAQPPANPPPGSAPAATTSAPPPAGTLATPPPTPGGSQATSGQYVTKFMQIMPQPKGTTQIRFFSQRGVDKALHTFSRRPQNLVPFFEGSGNRWEQSHFEKAGEYDVSYLVRWEQGAPLPGGNGYYRDIVSISPA